MNISSAISASSSLSNLADHPVRTSGKALRTGDEHKNLGRNHVNFASGKSNGGSPMPAQLANRFGGPLPAQSANRFSGPLPSQQVIKQVTNQGLNRFHGPLPAEKPNRFVGPLPAQQMIQPENDLTASRFSGPLPAQSVNRFEGPLPAQQVTRAATATYVMQASLISRASATSDAIDMPA